MQEDQSRGTLRQVKRLVLLAAILLALPEATLGDAQVPKPRPPPSSLPDAAAPPVEEAQWSAAAVSEAREACRALLIGLDIAVEPLDPIGTPGGCGAPAAVLVSEVAGVTLLPPATLTCDMAADLHGWISGTVKPAALKRLKAEVTAINTATSYACRRRNNSSSGKLSEHERANALDMSGFSFASEVKGLAVGGSNWGEGILAALGVSRDDSFLRTSARGPANTSRQCLGQGPTPIMATTSMWTSCGAKTITASASEAESSRCAGPSTLVMDRS